MVCNFKKLNIALISLSYLPKKGGMEYVVHDLATNIKKLGHNVIVFAPRLRKKEKEIEHNYKLIRFGSKIKGAYASGFNKLYLAYEFMKIHKKTPISVINSHSAYSSTDYALFLKRYFSVPVVITCHGHDIQRIPSINYGYRLNKKMNKIICNNIINADCTISIGPDVYNELIDIIPAEKIISIPNGIHFPSKNDLEKNYLRNNFGINEGPIIISVGRNHIKKSFDLGLETFKEVLKEIPNANYVHIGKDSESLIALSNELEIESSFFPIGELSRDNVFLSYFDSDLFFSPAKAESFGIVTYEAMYFNLPCVVSDGPGNKDAVVNNKNGYIVKHGDIKEGASAILKILSNDNLKRDFGKFSEKLVTENFSWNIVSEKYERAFENLSNSF